MSLGLLGRKVGMTRLFAEDGTTIPVTVVDVSNNRITQVKSIEVDGYTAVQVAFGVRRASRVNKAAAGHLAKAGVEAGEIQREFLVSVDIAAEMLAGSFVSPSILQPGQLVDVTGTTLGKGFTGVIKRHHFSSNRASHGNSRSHNTPGSIGQAQDPGRVFPGKRMAGHHGAVKRTVQKLEVIRVDVERQLLLIKGAIPGSKGGHVIVHPSVKAGA